MDDQVDYTDGEGKEIRVTFRCEYTKIDKRDERVNWVTFCIIRVCGTVQTYIGWTIQNPNDEYANEGGYATAFKRALRQRWEDRFRKLVISLNCPAAKDHWKRYSSYHRKLLAIASGKYTEDGFPL
jgi:hypothetical protein